MAIDQISQVNESCPTMPVHEPANILCFFIKASVCPATFCAEHHSLHKTTCTWLVLTSSLNSCASVSCRADADLKLLGSRKLPREAFKDKVVWITGASQVRPVPALCQSLTLASWRA